ncbi:bifunctional metallophosphatase/5'-nucleotidase [Phascolarctobacterium sp.]|uniref:bifunctional metallophosphatase/5'-nucleotidase n=1 Tax=Phascolarctobacterium sp. TaxID=2049039 RepID=UPI00386AB0E7
MKGLKKLFVISMAVASTTMLPLLAMAKDIVILHTNDIHCGVEDNLGMAKLSQLKKDLSADNHVILVDAGDAIQGTPLGKMSNGTAIVDIMNAVGYDFCIPGNHEFDFSMDNFLNNIVPRQKAGYYSANFTDLRTNKPVLPAYKIIEAEGKKIAFVGVTTPSTIVSSTPSFFQGSNGEYIYGFAEDEKGKAVAKVTQKAIDEARKKGADYVILVTHMGMNGSQERYQSEMLIENTKNVDAVLDGHSHERIPSWLIINKKDKRVVLGQTGTKLKSIGKLTITEDDNMQYELVTKIDKADPVVQNVINNVKAPYEKILAQPIGESMVVICHDDPKTGERMVRKQENSLGNLVADAFRTVMGADIGIVNGGGLRKDIPAGIFNYNNILQSMPFGNMVSTVEATGQQILDLLEMASSKVPGESGAFMSVSGMSYTIDTSIPSSVKLDPKGMFEGVEGPYRVTNVMVNGEPLDLNKKYIVAGPGYTLKEGGDGMNMLTKGKLLKDASISESDAVIEYIQNYHDGKIPADYANPYGEGRITIK